MKEGDVMNLEHPMVTHIRTHGYPKEADREQMRRHGGPAGYPQGGSMGKIVISYSSDRFDQWRLGEAGGFIAFTKDGKPVFQFDRKGQYERYLRLNRRRHKEGGR